MKVDPATPEEVGLFLMKYPQWRPGSDEVLMRVIETPDYAGAIAVVQKIGVLAEELNHHPILMIEWGKVIVTLTTHDAGNKISARDIDMAKKIDTIVP